MVIEKIIYIKKRGLIKIIFTNFYQKLNNFIIQSLFSAIIFCEVSTKYKNEEKNVFQLIN